MASTLVMLNEQNEATEFEYDRMCLDLSHGTHLRVTKIPNIYIFKCQMSKQDRVDGKINYKFSNEAFDKIKF